MAAEAADPADAAGAPRPTGAPGSAGPGADALVEAAGGLVWRRRGGVLEILVVHRPKYDDWSFPKGKLASGEDHPRAAVREVIEETGLAVSLGAELPEVRYVDRRGRPKRVRYWTMTATGGRFRPNDEVDRVEWLPVTEAGARLTYPRDAELAAALGEQLETGDGRPPG